MSASLFDFHAGLRNLARELLKRLPSAYSFLANLHYSELTAEA
jgi:hypothetical protein